MGITDFNIYKNTTYEIDNSIQGYGDPKVKGYFLVFIVKPDINFEANKKFFEGLRDNNIDSIFSENNANLFIKPLTNLCEGYSLIDYTTNTEVYLQNLVSEKSMQPMSFNGTSGGVFNIKFRELSGLLVSKIVKVWYNYIKAVTRGDIKPRDAHIRNNVIDYKSSAYMFAFKPDFKSIEYYAKFTGIYPNNFPTSVFSEELTQFNDVVLDIEFSYDRFDFLESDIIEEFNSITGGKYITKSNSYYEFSNTFFKERLKDVSGLSSILDGKTSITDEILSKHLRK